MVQYELSLETIQVELAIEELFSLLKLLIVFSVEIAAQGSRLDGRWERHLLVGVPHDVLVPIVARLRIQV